MTRNLAYFIKPILIAAIACSVACKQQPILEKMVYDCIEHSVSVCTVDASRTNLRIKNNSKYDFWNIKIIVNKDFEQGNVGNIKAGQSNCYHAFNKVYSNANTEFFVADKHFTYIPIDHVGEPKLGLGKFI